MLVIRECRIRPAEHIILEMNTGPYVNTALQSHPIANNGSAFHQRMGVQVALPTDLCALQHDSELPDLRVVAELRTLMYES